MEGDERADDEPVVDDEPTTPDPPVVDDPAPAPSDTPWAADLETLFEDPAVRGQVDGFVREKIQPYVTQLEQATQVNRDAERLWNDFRETPVDTFGAVAVELFGDEKAEELRALLAGETPPEEPPVTPTPDTYEEFSIDEDELPPHVREAVEYAANKKQQEEWDEAFADVQARNSDVEIVEELFYPFVTAADGDIDEAASSYKAWYEKGKTKFAGIEIDPDDIPDTNPPPVNNPKVDPAPSAPPEKQQQTLDEAMDEFFAEQNAPPTV